MPTEIITTAITGLLSVLAGGGGVFMYLNAREKNHTDKQELAASEWKHLYDEMKLRLDEQEAENKRLQSEIFELKNSITKLSVELQTYKKYDKYIINLEKYTDHLLHNIKGFVAEDAYKIIESKRPIKTEEVIIQ